MSTQSFPYSPGTAIFPTFLGKPSKDIILMVWVTLNVLDKLLRQTVVPLVAFLLHDLLTEL
jgi:hypothetical protein